MTNSPSADDRFLQLMEAIAQTRQLVEGNAEAIAEQRAAWAETRQVIESSSSAIEANSNAVAELRDELRVNITDVVSMISTMAEQAEVDRAETRATVRQILEVLTQRFTSNGH
jgi:predicted  nucleic acid-binding Zn-ribbon protein